MGKRLPFVLALTAVFEGIRAGSGLFRVLLDLPARFRLGPVAFAEFSRATDLSTRGIVFYVLYGFGGALLTAAAWLVASRARASRSVRALTGAACICSALVLILTLQAAPLMWSVGSSPNEPAMLADLLDRFTFWTTLRIACVEVSFLAIVTAMTILMLERQIPPSPLEGLATGARPVPAKVQ